MDSFKTELIADRVWRNRSQLELAVVEYIGWFNHDRLHEALGDIPPAEFEQRTPRKAAISGNGSVAALPPRPADRLHAARLERERASEPETALSGTTGPDAGFAGSTPMKNGNQQNPVSAEPSPAQPHAQGAQAAVVGLDRPDRGEHLPRDPVMASGVAVEREIVGGGFRALRARSGRHGGRWRRMCSPR